MKINQWEYNTDWQICNGHEAHTIIKNDLVLVFADRLQLEALNAYIIAKNHFLESNILILSTASNIIDDYISESKLLATAISFEKATISYVTSNISQYANSYEAGNDLFEKLGQRNLRSVLVFCDGALINGSELVEGMNVANTGGVSINGGLAGDGDRLERTLVGINETPIEGAIVLIGFYGDIEITSASYGGWDPFGPQFTITKSEKNVIWEIDNTNALALYKSYIGEYAEQLPTSGLYFPLCIYNEQTGQQLVRTILSIDEQNQSMTFAGNLPVGSKIRFMAANFNKLIDAAKKAADSCFEQSNNKAPELALVISCVGRKLVLNQRVEEEIEAVKIVFGHNSVITGFHSNGEISMNTKANQAQLHNQTMTITTFTEF